MNEKTKCVGWFGKQTEQERDNKLRRNFTPAESDREMWGAGGGGGGGEGERERESVRACVWVFYTAYVYALACMCAG